METEMAKQFVAKAVQQVKEILGKYAYNID